MPVSLHVIVLLPTVWAIGLSQWMDQFQGLTSQVPLLEPGGIEAFIRREVLPYSPDAWIDPSSIKTGYEISFTRYFYKPQPLRSLGEIRADILALEKETEDLLGEIVGKNSQ
jgi:type I restriction enzyme M protein